MENNRFTYHEDRDIVEERLVEKTRSERAVLEGLKALEDDQVVGMFSFKVTNNNEMIKGIKMVTEIGNGEHSRVYWGYSKNYLGKVAVKVFIYKDQLDESSFIHYDREVRALASYCPYLSPLVGFTTKSPFVIVTKYYEGNLSRVIGPSGGIWNKSLSGIEKTKIAGLLAKGMSVLHSKNIIHRDLKPENIFLDANMNPHIGDLGLSRIAAQNGVMTNCIGTLGYTAPEQMTNGAHYTSAVDVFSFGVILYEMVEKKPLQDQAGLQEKFAHIRGGEVLVVEGKCTASIKQLIWDCLEIPQQRPTFANIYQGFKNGNITFASKASRIQKGIAEIKKNKKKIKADFMDDQKSIIPITQKIKKGNGND